MLYSFEGIFYPQKFMVGYLEEGWRDFSKSAQLPLVSLTVQHPQPRRWDIRAPCSLLLSAATPTYLAYLDVALFKGSPSLANLAAWILG